MKKRILVILALALTACGKSEFGVAENAPDRIVIAAENAAEDAFFVTGTLAVAVQAGQ